MTATPPPGFAQMTARQKVVAVAHWGVQNRARFSYSQGPHRWEQITKPWQLPVMTDCSGWATTCYAWSGLPDPNGQHYGWGWTGTLATHGCTVLASQVLPGDLVIFWDNAALAGQPAASSHVAVVVASGADPQTVSMGGNGDPSLSSVHADGRAHRFYRYLPA